MKTIKKAIYPFLKDNSGQSYEVLAIKKEGYIVGYPVCVVANKSGYLVIEKTTGMALSSLTHKTIKNAIETEETHLIIRASGADSLKANFKTALSRAYKLN